MEDLLRVSAIEQAHAVRIGAVSALELTRAALAAAEDTQAALGAFAEVDAERALAVAATIGAGDPRPLAGVPYAVKDLAVACGGLRLTSGSRAFGEYRPTYDSNPVRRAKEAGLVVIGSTVAAEFGLLPVSDSVRFGPVRNPYDPTRSAGGSSGGAAAAVAHGAVAVAAASDAGGSIRIPAACCGVVGLKPSRGRVSLGPELGDHLLAVELGVTRTVADAAVMLDCLSGPEPGDATWAPAPAASFTRALHSPPDRARFAVCTTSPTGGAVAPAALAAIDDAAHRLQALGHIVEVVEFAWSLEPVLSQLTTVWSVGAAGFAAYAELATGDANVTDHAVFEPATAAFVKQGRALSASAFALSVIALQAWARSLVIAQAPYDAVLSPALAQAPPLIGMFADLTDVDAVLERALAFAPFTVLANITGQPAIVLRAGVDTGGLPVAVQLIGRPTGEAGLLTLAAQLEASLHDSDAQVLA